MKNDKPKKAVALKYNSSEDSAPKITAKGAGHVAEKIIELAKKEGIPITEDNDLAAALVKLDFQEEIPIELYAAVAEILAFAYGLNRRMSSEK